MISSTAGVSSRPAPWLVGTGQPSASLGTQGDLYLDGGSGIVYRKNGGFWAQLLNLKGAPQGYYEYTQTTPANTWVIDHYLGHLPVIETFDSDRTPFKALVTNPTLDRTVISINGAVSGYATLV